MLKKKIFFTTKTLQRKNWTHSISCLILQSSGDVSDKNPLWQPSQPRCSNQVSAVTASVNQMVETWKSFDCGHSWEVVRPAPSTGTKIHISEDVTVENNTSSVYLTLKWNESVTLIQLQRLCWRWDFSSPVSLVLRQRLKNYILKVHHLFDSFQRHHPLRVFFLFCLLAKLIPFLSQHVGGAASNQLTNRPQTGRREVTSYPLCSSFSEAALCIRWLFHGLHRRTAGRIDKSACALMDLNKPAHLKERSNSEICAATAPVVYSEFTPHKSSREKLKNILLLKPVKKRK